MNRKPVKQAPLVADSTTPLTDQQFVVMATLEPHYKAQVEKHPHNRWLRSHYGYIVSSLRRGYVYSHETLREGLVAGVLSPD